MNEITRQERDMAVDEIEAKIVNNLPYPDIKINHLFAEGMYAREMAAPMDSILTSKIHKTEHFFVLVQGSLLIRNDDGTDTYLEAPYVGVTKSGTRRVAIVVEDMIWITFHANPDNVDEYAIEERIIEQHENKLLHSYKNPIS